MTLRRAEIAGGGIGGLALGWALALHGWRVRVHERGTAIREIGAGIYLMNNSVSIFAHHGLAEEMLRRGVTLRATERRERDGRPISRRVFTPADQWYVMPRADLVTCLAEAARRAGVEIATGSAVEAIEPDGTLVTEAGARHRADLVVAADGFRSRLRDRLGLLAFARERSSGATRLVIPRGSAEADCVAREYWSGRCRVGITACSPDLTYAYLSAPNRDPVMTRLPVDTAAWARAFPALADFFARIPADAPATRHPYAYSRVTAWSKGRAAILGDAAHALPPTLAQGAGLAIANGYALAQILEREADVPTALREWERRYRWIADRTQSWSLRIDTLTTRWPRPLSFVRRGVVWAIGATDWINDRARVADRVRLTEAS